MYEGEVTAIRLDKGFGFIQSPNLVDDVFFHAKGLSSDLAFDETLTFRRVNFEIERTAKGMRAHSIRPAN